MNQAFLRLILVVARRDYLRTVRRRGFLLATLLLPASMGLIFVISTAASRMSAAEVSGPVIVVNESSASISANQQLAPDVVLMSKDQAEAQLASGEATSYYLVPATWPQQPTVLLVESTAANQGRALDLMTRQTAAQNEIELLLRVSLLQQAGVSDTTLAELLTPIDLQSVTTEGEPVSEASVAAGFIAPYIFTLIFVLSIFITSGYLLQSVTEEKENRVAEIILSSVPALPLMAGKILGLGVAGLTQIAIWVATALVALPLINNQFSLDITFGPSTIIIGLISFCLGYLSYGAIFAAIGAVAPGAREAQQYSSFFAFFAVIPVVLIPAVASDPTGILIWILALFPLTAPAAVLEVLTLSTSAPWLLIACSLISQVVFVLIATVATSRVFRATLLLYGTRPGVKQIVGAMTARP